MGRKRILVVDDERAFTSFVKAALEKTGSYEVCAETKAKRAFETAKTFKPDLVFMDITMPPTDGGEVAAQFKTDADLKEVPIIFLTGAVTREEGREGGGTVGGQPFLAKPVKVEELVAAI